MFNTPSFDALTKTMKENAAKFNPAATQEALKPMMAHLEAWGELAQKQTQAAQASMTATFESFKNIKEPQAAFEAMKTLAEQNMAAAAKNLKDVTALGIAQFHTSVDALEKAHPLPEAFSAVGKGMKAAASQVQTAVETAIKGNGKK
jgi:AICAR transformylase/IMP cyclohydrolase PurH